MVTKRLEANVREGERLFGMFGSSERDAVILTITRLNEFIADFMNETSELANRGRDAGTGEG